MNAGIGKWLDRQQCDPAEKGNKKDGQTSQPVIARTLPKMLLGKEDRKEICKPRRKQHKQKQNGESYDCLEGDKSQMKQLDVKEADVVGCHAERSYLEKTTARLSS